MPGSKHNETPVDKRILLYKGLKHFIAVFFLGLVVKSFIIDSVVIKGDQMSPALLNGDRVIYTKIPSVIPGIAPLPNRGTPVIFHSPVMDGNNILRVAAVSGDTVAVDNGVLYTGISPYRHSSVKEEKVIPSQYSPRDFMEPYILPGPGDSIRFSSLSIRNFFFSYFVLLQQYPDEDIELEVSIIQNDTFQDNFMIEDFSLYKGAVNKIPKSQMYDPFFWERLESHLKQNSNQDTRLVFSVLRNGQEIDLFTVTGKYVFLIADNWLEGLDSRFFGPVRSSFIKGRALGVLWSFHTDDDGNRHLIKSRIGKIIKSR